MKEVKTESKTERNKGQNRDRKTEIKKERQT